MREAENSTFKVCSVDEYMGITWDLVRNIDSHPQALTNWSRLCSLKKIHRLVLNSLHFEKPHNYSSSEKREILPAQGSGKAWRNMTPGVDFKNVSTNFKRTIKICPLLFSTQATWSYFLALLAAVWECNWLAIWYEWSSILYFQKNMLALFAFPSFYSWSNGGTTPPTPMKTTPYRMAQQSFIHLTTCKGPNPLNGHAKQKQW